ncbi:phosphotransferase family protein [Lewinella cohaerens]|uniref:phosphotransferase family protein n=1 Tax=Lewinella cohaerens TaxID=70995 RepID=UPI000379D520|nr:phosphotransferase family protein [Lewinella cohaerens]
MQDQTIDVRSGEKINIDTLSVYLKKHVPELTNIIEVRQFPGGFSNLTYLLRTNLGDWVLRRPPLGAKIKSAHDMAREYRVLEKMRTIYGRIPALIHLCEDETLFGYTFYIMERVEGVILRNKPPKGLDLSPPRMRAISEATIDNLALLHQINIESTGLSELGKPEGYVARQVSGWTKRYHNAQTDDIAVMEELANWMVQNQPADGYPGLIHNDYKYDNLVLDQAEPARILAVLDWEMATVGDTRMDLGTSLAYWSEAPEAKVMQLAAGNLTWLPGNLTRMEVVERYQHTTGHQLDDILFYFVYGAFKIGVIVQQIYSRWKQGHSKDPRFGELIHAVHYFGNLARLAIEKDRISRLL